MYSHLKFLSTWSDICFILIHFFRFCLLYSHLSFLVRNHTSAHHNLGPLQIETAQIIRKIRDHLSPNTGYFGVIFLVSQSERATLAPTELIKYANCRSGPILTQQNTGILSDSIICNRMYPKTTSAASCFLQNLAILTHAISKRVKYILSIYNFRSLIPSPSGNNASIPAQINSKSSGI